MLSNSKLAALYNVNLVVAVGSVDGVCTTAALLRLIGKKDVEVCFAQAFTVDKLPVASWSGRTIVFVDLAVNNRDPEMTRRFIDALRQNNNTLVAIIDEHSREDWREIIDLDTWDQLVIQPESQNDGPGAPKSSGEVLYRVLKHEQYDHGCYECQTGGGETCVVHQQMDALIDALLHDADAADRMDFATRIGGVVNKAVKSAIADDTRRVYLAKHFAYDCDPDSKINGWIAEYDQILADHEVILAAKVDLGDGIVRVSTIGRKVDMTTLMVTLYKSGAKVVVCEGEMFDKAKGCKTRQIAFGTNDKSFDVLACVKSVVPSASGFAQKANVDPEHEDAALTAIRIALAAKLS